MNTMTDNYLTPDALAVIERARALAVKLAERAQQADRGHARRAYRLGGRVGDVQQRDMDGTRSA